ncbi:hypothetical protein [Vulcanisaeta souniana]|uniref:Uncharacterized protein n=3 Tax=Vulcanisaeta souniana TaxID=164452 RepID=A0A830E813_9CREN|nr:hypothetical protein [Vulcanisaeta souniana]BDR91400.1 hypothetical protein Vsou_04930 [Vulcanisaeta souniana JCM 11219]GGI72885.1 hypothetical protein GCM10007112_07140 [Vulcanisaeta souniana JCM 11219]
MSSLEIDLRNRDKYENVIRAIDEYGLSIKESIFENLPSELMVTYQRIREIYVQEVTRDRGRVDVDSLIQLYMNVPKTEELLRYLLLATVLFTGFQNLRNELIYRVMMKNYEAISRVITNPSYSLISDISIKLLSDYENERAKRESIQDINEAMHSFIYGLRKLTKSYGTTLIKWLPKFRNIEAFERALPIFYPPKVNERRRRAIRTFIRWVSHETNLPIALGILTRGNYRHYTLIADVYSTMVTIRSGAFLALNNDHALRIINKILPNKDSGLTIKVDEVKGLVRAVGKLSGDPIIYERGAFRIGHEYCSRLKCSECPLNKVCMKLTWVNIK